MNAQPASTGEEVIVWVDVETDRLEARGGSLLEVAAIITDTNLVELDPQGFHSVIHHSTEDVARMRREAAPIVDQMHETTGLWDRLPESKTSLSDVDTALLAYIKGFAPGHRQGRVGGNSVRLDLNFLDEHLPGVAGHLHYRFIDVTTVQTLGGWWNGIDDRPIHANAHTAMADIRASLDQLRRLRGLVFDR